MINLSSTAPAAPSGGTNVAWQQDSSGDVSAYVAVVKNTIAPVAGVLTLDASTGNSFLITVNAAITSMTIINPPSDGGEITLLWQQDSTGHAVTVATNMQLGSLTITTTASKSTCFKMSYNVGDENWYTIGQNNL